jgi:hypothetical protein
MRKKNKKRKKVRLTIASMHTVKVGIVACTVVAAKELHFADSTDSTSKYGLHMRRIIEE